MYRYSKEQELDQTLKQIQEDQIDSGNAGAWGTMGQSWVGDANGRIPDLAKSMSSSGTSVSGFGPPTPIEYGGDVIVNYANYLTDYEGARSDLQTVAGALVSNRPPSCQASNLPSWNGCSNCNANNPSKF
jgi:hypothetical protein